MTDNPRHVFDCAPPEGIDDFFDALCHRVTSDDFAGAVRLYASAEKEPENPEHFLLGSVMLSEHEWEANREDWLPLMWAKIDLLRRSFSENLSRARADRNQRSRFRVWEAARPFGLGETRSWILVFALEEIARPHGPKEPDPT